MPTDRGTAERRQEAILTALAKLEQSLREQARLMISRADEARHGRQPVSHAYYSGRSDGLLAAALQVSECYETAVRIGGDPAVR